MVVVIETTARTLLMVITHGFLELLPLMLFYFVRVDRILVNTQFVQVHIDANRTQVA